MKYTFDLIHTNIAKGFFILVMVFHHVFAIQMNYWINLSDPNNLETNALLMDIASYGKVCVGGFCFLSAYGITKKYKSLSIKKCKNFIISRLIKLYFGFWPIYIIGLIGTLLWGNTPISEIYSSPSTGQFSWILPFIDAFGFAEILSLGTLNRTWWYIFAAVFIIILTPFFYKLFIHFKFIFAVIVCILPYILGVNLYNILFTISMLGIVFAENDLFSKLKTRLFKHSALRILTYILIPLLFYPICIIINATSIVIAMPIFTVICILFCYFILADIPILRTVLTFFGKHSANIFYVHSFIFLYWFTYTIYNLNNKFLIYGVVFGCALLISIAVEFFKKIVRYNKLEKFVITHLTKPICKTDS